MIIEIQDQSQDLIVNFDLPSNPFKVGEIITIRKNIRTTHEGTWDVEPMNKKFEVLRIEHEFRVDYASKAYENFITTVTVKEYV